MFLRRRSDPIGDPDVQLAQTRAQAVYPQKNWSAYRESQHHEKTYVERMLRDLCVRVPQPPRRPGPGRNRRLQADLVFESVMKVYTGLSASRLIPDLAASCARGYLDTVGHENCIHDFLAREDSTPLLVGLVEEAGIPLGAIDAHAVRGRIAQARPSRFPGLGGKAPLER